MGRGDPWCLPIQSSKGPFLIGPGSGGGSLFSPLREMTPFDSCNTIRSIMECPSLGIDCRGVDLSLFPPPPPLQRQSKVNLLDCVLSAFPNYCCGIVAFFSFARRWSGPRRGFPPFFFPLIHESDLVSYVKKLCSPFCTPCPAQVH